LQFLAAAHIARVNCAKITKDSPKELAYEIFIIKRSFSIIWVSTF